MQRSDINNGGCAIWAIAYKRKNPNVKIHWGFSDVLSKQFDKAVEGELEVPNHAFVETEDGVFLDATSTALSKEGLMAKYNLSLSLEVGEEYALSVVNECSNWNESFDRREGIPFIAKDIGIEISQLSDIKIEVEEDYSWEEEIFEEMCF